MDRALMLAECGRAAGEVPVGALVVCGGVVIGEGWNRPVGSQDPTAHAEVVALRAAAAALGNYRLTGATLYVTIEPCTMCTGALVHARIARLVYGAEEPRAGAIRSAARALDNAGMNHRVEVTGGVRAAAAAALLTRFFRERRARPGGSTASTGTPAASTAVSTPASEAAPAAVDPGGADGTDASRTDTSSHAPADRSGPLSASRERDD